MIITNKFVFQNKNNFPKFFKFLHFKIFSLKYKKYFLKKIMISYIKWKIIELEFNYTTILTKSWVWYEIWINELIYAKLALEEETELFVYHHKTENSEGLFWFTSKTEKKIFIELIKISWVWWKVAMQILSLWVEKLLVSAKNWDNKTIETIKWVWKKMAEKIILEFRDKDFWVEFLIKKEEKNEKKTISEDLFSSIKTTLTNMGYDKNEVEKILKNLPENLKDAGEIIPYVIRNLS